MDVAVFKNLMAISAPFVAEYHSRQERTQVQMYYRDSKECSNGERIIIDEWLTNNSKWLVDNEAKYNKCLALLALPKQDIEDLYAAYESLCGGNDDTGV
jgi:hypothetical protein